MWWILFMKGKCPLWHTGLYAGQWITRMRCWWIRLKWECLRWIQGVSLREHTRSKEIRKMATVQPITTHLMQKRLLWYGHVRCRDDSHMTRTVLDMEVEGVRPRGRTKLRYMDIIQSNIGKDWRMAVSRAAHWCGRAFKVSKQALYYMENEYRSDIYSVLTMLMQLIYKGCTWERWEYWFISVASSGTSDCVLCSRQCASR